MGRKRITDEDALRLLREIEVHLATGHDVSEACRKAGISDATYYNWRRKFGGVGRSQLSEMRALEIEARARRDSKRLKTSRSDGRAASLAELDKLILKRCPVGDCLQSPRGRAWIL